MAGGVGGHAQVGAPGPHERAPSTDPGSTVTEAHEYLFWVSPGEQPTAQQ